MSPVKSVPWPRLVLSLFATVRVIVPVSVPWFSASIMQPLNGAYSIRQAYFQVENQVWGHRDRDVRWVRVI